MTLRHYDKITKFGTADPAVEQARDTNKTRWWRNEKKKFTCSCRGPRDRRRFAHADDSWRFLADVTKSEDTLQNQRRRNKLGIRRANVNVD
jgi:hypothetical protein